MFISKPHPGSRDHGSTLINDGSADASGQSVNGWRGTLILRSLIFRIMTFGTGRRHLLRGLSVAGRRPRQSDKRKNYESRLELEGHGSANTVLRTLMLDPKQVFAHTNGL